MSLYAKATSSSSFGESCTTFEKLVQRLTSTETLELRHEALEAILEQEGRALMRQLLQDHLHLRRLREVRRAEVEGSDGTCRTHVRPRERSLMSVFGPVRVERLSYGADGASSLSPLDAELNLPRESYSYGVRRQAAFEASKGSFEQVVASLRSMTGASVPKRQVEQLAQRAAADFERFYKQRPVVPADAGDLLVLSTDAKGIVMRSTDLRIETRQALERATPKLTRRLTRGETSGRKRMAQVATVYDVAPHVRTPEEVAGEFAPVRELQPRPRPHNKRVWASLDKEAEFVLTDMFREALRRDPEQRRRWIAVVDGHRSQLGTLRRVIRRFGVKAQIVLDIVHVLERLWAASMCFYTEADPRREAWVSNRLLRILQGKVSGVAAGIRRSSTRQGLSKPLSKLVGKCARYLLTNKALMRYDEYLSLGLPIASGVVEGACRHLIKDRFDITGARWSLVGAEAVLQLRAVRVSGDFEEYWTFHLEQQLQRQHLAHYKPALEAAS